MAVFDLLFTQSTVRDLNGYIWAISLGPLSWFTNPYYPYKATAVKQLRKALRGIYIPPWSIPARQE